jgi:peptidoglycan/xylan/chitin deacetylase (PgdA/CDA1 family)
VAGEHFKTHGRAHVRRRARPRPHAQGAGDPREARLTLRSTLRASDQEFSHYLALTERVLGLQGSPKLFRPPGGRIRASQLRLAEASGYRVVLGSAYPFDPSHPPRAYLEWLVTKNLEPGVIVILHDGIADPSRTIAALDSILAAGTRKGLRFVTVGELLRAEGG